MAQRSTVLRTWHLGMRRRRGRQEPTSDEEMHSTGLLDEVLEALALGDEVGRVPVEHVRVARLDVHVLEELVPHVVVVGLGVVTRET